MMAEEISEVFLSTTALDCQPYRRAVKNSVERNIPGGKVYLQEDWAHGAALTVHACRERFEACDAYVGLFGYRYGWQPPSEVQSITELEFEWACELWKDELAPPFFIILPVPASPADRYLARAADKVLAKEFAHSRVLQEAEKQKQQTFLRKVKAWLSQSGRMMIVYHSPQQLREKALSAIQNWNLDLLKQALATRRTTRGSIPDDELGRIGRNSQITALESAVVTFQARERAEAPAMALLVHGLENSGQLPFARFLHQWPDWGTDRILIGQPPDADEPGALLRWLAGQLPVKPKSPAEAEALVDAISASYRGTDLVVIIQSLGRQGDRLHRFVAEFWKPLVAALASPGRNPPPGRLFCVVVNHTLLEDSDRPVVWEGDLDVANVDCAKLLPLPPLGVINAEHVKAWLKETGLDLDLARRAQIANSATHSPEGHPDGHPANVFDRLNREGFWNQES